MKNEKTVEIIEAIKGMTEQEAYILEVFISGFRAGKQASDREAAGTPPISQVDKAG